MGFFCHSKNWHNLGFFFHNKRPLGPRGRVFGLGDSRPERMRSVDASHRTEWVVWSGALPDRTFGSYRGPKLIGDRHNHYWFVNDASQVYGRAFCGREESEDNSLQEGLHEEGECRQLEFWAGKGANIRDLFCTTRKVLKLHGSMFWNI